MVYRAGQVVCPSRRATSPRSQSRKVLANSSFVRLKIHAMMAPDPGDTAGLPASELPYYRNETADSVSQPYGVLPQMREVALVRAHVNLR